MLTPGAAAHPRRGDRLRREPLPSRTTALRSVLASLRAASLLAPAQ